MKQTHDLIQDLSQEHVTIKSILKIITEIVENTNLKKFHDVKDVEGIINFIDDYVVKNHYRKEELLFHSLLSIVTKSEIEAFNVLMQDHINETAIVKEIIMALDKCKSISPGSFQVITNNLKIYVDMLQTHILVEDITTFPLIDKLLTEQMRTDITVQFEDIQKKVFKKTTKEQYEQFILKLDHKYVMKGEVLFY